MSWSPFSDIFAVYRIDKPLGPDSKVSRVRADGERTQMELQLDVATADYPIKVGERFHIALESTLNLPDEILDTLNYTDGANIDGLDVDVDYIARGRLCSITHDPSDPKNTEVEMRASFGGLLMILKGGYPLCDIDDPFKPDVEIFLLMRKESCKESGLSLMGKESCKESGF